MILDLLVILGVYFSSTRTQGVTQKDLDFIENKTKLLATYDEYSEVMSIIKKDAKFFEENNIIDYSLLVGIHYKQAQSKTKFLDFSKSLISLILLINRRCEISRSRSLS